MALACNFITRWLLLRVYILDISLNLLNVLIPLLRNLLMRPYKSVGGEPTCTLVHWRQGFRHPTGHECMGWFAQIIQSSVKAAFDDVLGMQLHNRVVVVACKYT